MKDIIIVSPHPDDECIGLYSVLVDPNTKPIIIYTENVPQNRRDEALKLREHVEIKSQLFQKNTPQTFIDPDNVLYFPHPTTETHFAHRLQGAQGEQLARAGFNVIFYSINMNAHFISEVKEPDKKEELLNKVYPSQASLWKYEKKYIFFEGKCKWIF